MKEPGKIIVVEGIWGAGKTTRIKELTKGLHALRISEPDHRKSGRMLPRAITRWYFNAHHKNLNRALVNARKGHTIIVERSVLSSAVFSALYLHDVAYQHDIAKFKKQIRDAKKACIDFRILYLPPRDIPRTVSRMKRNPHLRPFAEKKFLRAFDQHLRKMIKALDR